MRQLIHLHKLTQTDRAWVQTILAAPTNATWVVLREDAIKAWLAAPMTLPVGSTVAALKLDAMQCGVTEAELSSAQIIPISDIEFAQHIAKAERVWSLP